MPTFAEADPQDDWVKHLGQCMRTCGRSVADGWQAASNMLQYQADSLDPTCSCKKVCDKSQLVVPVVVADDEVLYQYAGHGVPGTSPFTPRKNAVSTASSSSAPFHIEDDNRDTIYFEYHENLAQKTQDSSRLSSLFEEDSRDCRPGWRPLPPPDDETFSYYAEYVPIIRPPSTVASSSLVQTSVRAAPWAKWDTSKASRTGGTSEHVESPATQALRALKETASREAVESTSPTSPGALQPDARQGSTQATTRQVIDAVNDTQKWEATSPRTSIREQRPALMMSSHGVPPVPPTPPEALGLSNKPAGLQVHRHEAASNVGSAWAPSWLSAATSWFTGETTTTAVPLYPGQSAPTPQTATGALLSGEQATMPTPDSVEERRQEPEVSPPPDLENTLGTPVTNANTGSQDEVVPAKKKELSAKANATKSVLSMNSGLQSSAAMALGALSKGNTSRRGKAEGINDLSSVLEARSSEQENTKAAVSSSKKDSTAKLTEPAPSTSPPADNPPPTSKPKPERRPPGQTKSVLSQSMNLQSSTAMALGSLMNKSSAPRRDNGTERGDLQSVVVPGAKSSIEPVQDQQEPEATSTAGTSVTTGSKTPVPTNSKPRRKGPDAKSVISGLGNSSSSASSLLGPMLQGQQKRRKRPEGGDMASVVE